MFGGQFCAGNGVCLLQQSVRFTNPPFGSASNIERNEFYGPGFWDWDVTLAKRMTITEKVKAELRFEGYNILNHPHFLNPGTDASALGKYDRTRAVRGHQRHLYPT